MSIRRRDINTFRACANLVSCWRRLVAAGIGFIAVGLTLLLFARTIYSFNAQLNQKSELGRWLYQYKDDP